MKNSSREKNLIKNTIILSIGTICTKLITFFLLPLYTSILNTEEYGIVDLLNTLVYLLLPIVTFQVEQAVFRELIEYRNNEKGKLNIISNCILSVIVQCIIFSLICSILSPFLKNDYKIFLFFNVIVSIFASLFLQIARGLGDNKNYSIACFISAFSTIVFNIVFLVIIQLRVEGMLIGTLLGQAICAIYLFIILKLYKYIHFSSFSWKTIKRLWKYSLPLIPNAISWWVFSSSDRVIVSAFLGLSMNGILSAASKFSSMYITLYNIFDRSWIESVSLHINDEDICEYFNQIFNTVLKLFSSLVIVLIAFMPIIYKIMVDENYSLGYQIVPILLLGSLFTVGQGLIAVIYAAKKDTKAIAKTSILAAIFNIVIHLLCIRFIGIYAAAISTLIAYFVIFIYRLIDIRKRYLKINIDKHLLFSSSISIILILIVYYINNFYLNIIAMTISIIYAILCNKDTIANFINSILKGLKRGADINEN